MKDISARAISVLSTVDIIAAEDTRVTSKLCQLLGIKNTLISLQKFNEKSRIKFVLDELKSGKDIALVSDAGTPVISDPGALLIQKLREGNIDIIPIPGPSAVSTLLSVAGIPADQYMFAGFFPKRKKDAEIVLNKLSTLQLPIIFFESPKRIKETLSWLSQNRDITFCCVAKELTKKFETIVSGSIDAVIKKLDDVLLKGEFTFLIHENNKQDDHIINTTLIDTLKDQGLATKDILSITALLDYPKNKVYDYLVKKIES